MRRRLDLAVAVVALLLIVVALTAPIVPYEYDGAGWWLPRVEMERDHAGAVVGLLRSPTTLPRLVPWLGVHRYPEGAPMVIGALARWFPGAVPAARIAALWTSVLLVGVLVAIRRRARDEDAAGFAVLLGVMLCPFVFVHLRAGYLDLSLGALAALFVMAIMDGLGEPARRWWQLRVLLFGSLLAQWKLEGALHAFTLIAAVTLCAERTLWRERLTVAAFAGIVVGVNLLVWQLLLWLLPPSPLPPSLFVWTHFRPSTLIPFGFQVLRHAIDFTTWGGVWPVVLGAALTGRRWAALVAFAFSLALFAVCYAAGPPNMIKWAAQGIQLNRLLLQMLIAILPLVVLPAAPTRVMPSFRSNERLAGSVYS